MLKEWPASDEGAALVVSGWRIPFLANTNTALIFLLLFSSKEKSKNTYGRGFKVLKKEIPNF